MTYLITVYVALDKIIPKLEEDLVFRLFVFVILGMLSYYELFEIILLDSRCFTTQEYTVNAGFFLVIIETISLNFCRKPM
jgi:hypothetical protein